MKLKVDLHTHTSEDPLDVVDYSAFQLIDKACKLEYDAIAITNHDSVTDTPEILDYAKRKGLLLLPGMEATLSQRHIVIINPAIKQNPKGSTIEDLHDMITTESLVIAPHPFFPQARSLRSLFFKYPSIFDAVEYSHFYSRWFNWNKKAVQQAEILNLPLVGTSDCHLLWEFGTSYTIVDADKEILSIVEAVKQGKIELITTPLSTFQIGRVLLKLIQIKAGHLLSRSR